MAKQTVVVLDNPPLDKDSWAEKVFAQAKLTPVSNEAIAEAMSKDEKSRTVLLENAGDPVAAAQKLAPFYKKALEKLYGKERRLGLYGTAWLVYTPIDACVIDWSEVERRFSPPALDPTEAARIKGRSRDFVRSRVAKHMAPGRTLELGQGLQSHDKVSQSITFLRTLGLLV